MNTESRRLSVYMVPDREPERGRYIAALIRQEWREGMTHADVVRVTTNWDALRLLDDMQPGAGEAHAAALEQQWRENVPALTLPAILAALGVQAA